MGGLTHAPTDAEAMPGLEWQRLEYPHVEGALEEVGFGFGHGFGYQVTGYEGQA